RRRHPELVALEVDHAILALVTAAETTHGDVAVIVPAAALAERLRERLLRLTARDLGEIRHRPEARSGRDGLELTSWNRSGFLSLRRFRSYRPHGASRSLFSSS